MMPGLGKKFQIELDIVEKPKDEYMTDEYFDLDLPVAPAVMVGDEIVVEGTDVSKSRLENIVKRHLRLQSPENVTMEKQFTSKDKDKIHKAIRKKYKKVARSPHGLFKYPTGRAGLETLQYDNELISKLPESVAASFCGVGNPFCLGPILEKEVVLDVGCGAGVDTIIAALMMGPVGKAVGIDIISDMLERAKNNISLMELNNIYFQEASAENIPFADEHFDVVISNGAINLVPFKVKAFSEIYRVLKPAGRLMLADNVLIGEMPANRKRLVKSWSQ